MPGHETMIVEAEDLKKSFPLPQGQTHEILHGIDAAVAEGEFVAIVGPSGSGKSTLLHCLSGLERPTSGTVRLAGTDLGRASNTTLARLRRGTVGFIFQSYNLVDSLTAGENVALQTRLAKQPAENANAALNAVGLDSRINSKPAQLSGGEQQRVAIARALAAHPRVLFADEPTGSLDSNTGENILELLRDVSAQGSSVVVVTHDLEAAAKADRVLVLRDGRLHGEFTRPTPAQLFDALTNGTTAHVDTEASA